MVIISCKKSIEDRLNDGCFVSICYDSLFVFQGNFSLCPSFHFPMLITYVNMSYLLISFAN